MTMMGKEEEALFRGAQFQGRRPLRVAVSSSRQGTKVSPEADEEGTGLGTFQEIEVTDLGIRRMGNGKRRIISRFFPPGSWVNAMT